MRKPIFVAREQQRCRPDCAFMAGKELKMVADIGPKF